jgi:hypothetical protein
LTSSFGEHGPNNIDLCNDIRLNNFCFSLIENPENLPQFEINFSLGRTEKISADLIERIICCI